METSVPPSPSRPPAAISPRFTLELEFVLALSNPYYLQHLAQTYPHLLNPSTSSDSFAAYLAYLYDYWRTPQYSKYLTHPGAVLRNLELLQQERFRRDVIRPDLLASLLDVNGKIAEGDTGIADGTSQEQDGGEDKGDAERMDEAAG